MAFLKYFSLGLAIVASQTIGFASAQERIERSDAKFKVAASPGLGENADTQLIDAQRLKPMRDEIGQDLAGRNILSACERYEEELQAIQTLVTSPKTDALSAALDNAARSGQACLALAQFTYDPAKTVFANQVSLSQAFRKGKESAGACYMSFVHPIKADKPSVLDVRGFASRCSTAAAGNRAVVSTFFDDSLQGGNGYAIVPANYAELLATIETVHAESSLDILISWAEREHSVRSLTARSKAYDVCPDKFSGNPKYALCVEKIPALCESVIDSDTYTLADLMVCLKEKASQF